MIIVVQNYPEHYNKYLCDVKSYDDHGYGFNGVTVTFEDETIEEYPPPYIARDVCAMELVEIANTVSEYTSKKMKEYVDWTGREDLKETLILRLSERNKQELIGQYNKAYELLDKMELMGNREWFSCVSGMMQTLGYLIDKMDSETGKEEE